MRLLRGAAARRVRRVAIQLFIDRGVVMSVFTPAEIAFIKTQLIGRIATVGPSGKPHVVPVGFRYNPEQDSIDIGGRPGLTARKHYRDLVRNHQGAFVIDDIPSLNPWTTRGLEIRGE